LRQRTQKDGFTFALNINYGTNVPGSMLVTEYIKDRQLELVLKPLYLSLIKDNSHCNLIVFRRREYSGLSTLLRILFYMFKPLWTRWTPDHDVDSRARCIFSDDVNKLPLSLLDSKFNYCLVVDNDYYIPKRDTVHVVNLPLINDTVNTHDNDSYYNKDFFDQWKQSDFDYFFQLIVRAGLD